MKDENETAFDQDTDDPDDPNVTAFNVVKEATADTEDVVEPEPLKDGEKGNESMAKS